MFKSYVKYDFYLPKLLWQKWMYEIQLWISILKMESQRFALTFMKNGIKCSILDPIYSRCLTFNDTTKRNISNLRKYDDYSNHRQTLTKFFVPEMFPVKDDSNRST